jgi:UDPglucose 6-dehydrogenase
MKITIFGAGYVGLVTGVCFAELGNSVICVDVDQQKLSMLQRGETPIYEPGLTEMLQRNLRAGRIMFTDDMQTAVQHGLFQFIAVGTPSDEDGSADLSYVLAVAKSIGESMSDYRIIVNKSTVPLTTADKVREVIQTELNRRHTKINFDIVSNPEFLKEGAAINDFMNPDRIVIGADNPEVLEKMRDLYGPLIDQGQRFIAMDLRSAELTKYAANAFLATKISFMNEMSRLSDYYGTDIDLVRKGMGTDPRIGSEFLFAGCGYGGSCFPKDVRAILKMADQANVSAKILQAVEQVNIEQKQILLEKINQYFSTQLKNKVIAVWGLAFKPNTNDMRDASSRVLLEGLWQCGAKVQAYDPIAIPEAKHIYGERADFKLCTSPEMALEGADVLAVVTEWQEFRHPNFKMIKEKLRYPAIFDGRNLYNPAQLNDLGFDYYGIGRGATTKTESEIKA